jgi:hypothetical protein
MGVFTISISDSDYLVTKSETSTDCSSIFSYKIEADTLSSIDISLSGSHQGGYYIQDSVTVDFTDSVTGIIFDSELTVYFYIDNSGVSGTFLDSDVTITNNSSSNVNNVYTDTAIRESDDQDCDDKSSSTTTFDSLIDTPDNKTGKSLNILRVSSDESEIEYVDSGSFGIDLNYVHTQSSVSASWVIPHSLGKYPIPLCQDSSGNTVHGDITYTDANNITITFNTAFSGVAYLN